MLSDEILAEQILKGDISAFEEIVNRYKKSVFAVVYRMIGQYQEAEDITQEIFLNVYEKIYQFDKSKKLSPWVHRIAVNTSISALRKKKKIISINFDEAFIGSDSYSGLSITNPQIIMERKELKTEVNNAIMELPESYRIVIILRYQMEFSNQEIAEVIETSRENVEVRIHRARKALRRIILSKCQERGIIHELSRY
ncbi:MAG: sigma-70 family RNA polymerase sigma factor [Syntrophomonadaceae bacterium]|nr:sigma-70 family RNA polymerase sigma factor [Syntrophomonadaceae bacterium]MDD3022969.1 sigma-70 family RNA polymerase sigma factor [Syntrophomonadaceae bacterium]